MNHGRLSITQSAVDGGKPPPVLEEDANESGDAGGVPLSVVENKDEGIDADGFRVAADTRSGTWASYASTPPYTTKIKSKHHCIQPGEHTTKTAPDYTHESELVSAIIQKEDMVRKFATNKEGILQAKGKSCACKSSPSDWRICAFLRQIMYGLQAQQRHAIG
jgi:hypothetical protein